LADTLPASYSYNISFKKVQSLFMNKINNTNNDFDVIKLFLRKPEGPFLGPPCFPSCNHNY